MYLHIHDSRTLKELQDDFSSVFPYLRLEFYTRRQRAGQHASSRSLLNPFLQVVTIRRQHRNGAIEIREQMKAKQVEQLLKREYSLPAEVLHYTKAGWLQTEVADEATLQELNEQGRADFHSVHNVFAHVRNLV
jgi:hypothetical protein